MFLNIKYVFCFSAQICLEHFSFEEKIQKNTVEILTGLNVKCLLLLYGLKKYE
jgi:hypothetical protein